MKIGMMNGVALIAGALVLGVGGPWLARELRSLPHPAALAARADSRVVTLDVGGMTCKGCVAMVGEELREVKGVSAVDVRLAQKKAFVVCDRTVSDSALVAAVHRAGPGFLPEIASR